MSAAYRDLREFIQQLESVGELRRVTEAVSPHLEMTAVCDRVLRQMGPALLFENPTNHTMPVLGNLFGTQQRVARAMGVQDVRELLAGRCGAARHLGAGHHARAAQAAAESGHLPTAGSVAQPAHHALAAAPGWRAGFS